jgi:SAM-dependent methyltransferase
MLHEIENCEVCGNHDLVPVINLGLHPMCDDLVPVGQPRVCKEYPIEILFCDTCKTAHQRFQIPKQDLFPQTYHYRSRHTADVIKGMHALVDSCEKIYGDLTDKKVLDIGCNDGSLLSIFAAKGAQTYGIEPTSAFSDAIQNGHKGLHAFLSEDVARDFVEKFGKPDVITFTNVFAHIEDLKAVIRALQILMHSNTYILIENHYLGAVIDKFQFDTFYHEHPRTYSFTSFAYMADSLGLQIGNVEFPARYNGNIRVIYMPKGAKSSQINLDEIYAREKYFGDGLKEMAAKIGPWQANKRASLEAVVKTHGKIRAKAFPGRAAILVKMLGLDSDLIEAVYEKPLSGKINHYVPGTRIPILSDDDLDLTETQKPLLNLAWHISEEIKSYLKNRGYQGTIIDILSQEDRI